MRYAVICGLSSLLVILAPSPYGFAQTESGDGNTNPSLNKDETEEIKGPICFMENFSGTYKTYWDKGYKFPGERFVFVHRGPCKCEGKTPIDCTEPGDDKN